MGSLRNYEWHCILSSSTISFPFPAPHIASPSFSAPFSHSCSPDDLPLSAPIFSFLSPTLATSPQKKKYDQVAWCRLIQAQFHSGGCAQT